MVGRATIAAAPELVVLGAKADVDPSPSMSTGNKDDSQLTTWALDQGCRLSGVTVGRHSSFGGYGLFNSIRTTSTDEDDDRIALFIPNSIIISIDLISEEANESDELADVLNALPPIPTLEPILTIFLLYQIFLRRTGKQNKWSTYIDYLPRSTLLPITWNKSEVGFLVKSNTTISQAVPAKLSFLKKIHAFLQGASDWFQKFSEDDYILAESWVASRTIEDPRANSPILVPVLDMANHFVPRNAAWEVTEDGIELRREPLDIGHGQELTISYDLERGTAERLYRYGFVEDSDLRICSKGFTLFDRVPAEIPAVGGHIYHFTLASVEDSFKDLSFLTYENWYILARRRVTVTGYIF
jgi:hypothetical protein